MPSMRLAYSLLVSRIDHIENATPVAPMREPTTISAMVNILLLSYDDRVDAGRLIARAALSVAVLAARVHE